MTGDAFHWSLACCSSRPEVNPVHMIEKSEVDAESFLAEKCPVYYTLRSNIIYGPQMMSCSKDYISLLRYHLPSSFFDVG